MPDYSEAEEAHLDFEGNIGCAGGPCRLISCELVVDDRDHNQGEQSAACSVQHAELNNQTSAGTLQHSSDSRTQRRHKQACLAWACCRSTAAECPHMFMGCGIVPDLG